MSATKLFLVKIIDVIFGRRKVNERLKKRILNIESLEIRELLTVSPLLPEMFYTGDSDYVTELTNTVNMRTAETVIIPVTAEQKGIHGTVSGR
jgi:hypothetical protein